MFSTDKKAISAIFREFRKAGFAARQNFTCCQTCGWAEITDKYDLKEDSNAVFYHNQDNDAFNKKGNLESKLHLAWNGDGIKLKEIIERYGYHVEWDGTENQRIAIVPKNVMVS